MGSQPAVYGVLAEFDSPERLVSAVRSSRGKGYTRMDAYTPFPVEGLAEALGLKRTYVPLLALAGGIVGALGGYYMQYWISAVDYPLNVGGRPFNSWPSFIPVTFELTVLLAALATVLGMLALNKLPLPYHPVFHVPQFAMATRDRFFLCIKAADRQFVPAETAAFLIEQGARATYDVPL